MNVWRTIGHPQPGGIVAICDHASNQVPPGYDLGVPQAVLDDHMGWDIGAAGVTEHLAADHAIPGFLACVSRLVIDLHREEDSAGLIPEVSDGFAIRGNKSGSGNPDRAKRIATLHRPYHAALAEWLDAARPALILAIHSFTPRLASAGAERPWHVGLLYNQDARAARHAIELFGAEDGMMVGDNEPYSGLLLNATQNRHAEAHGRPYCAIELRNDLIRDTAGRRDWAARIAHVAGEVARRLG
ncbi:N-formylglutamate amidohydrolase [Croceibacterium mercuriale]|uniref:N-formylglutamate amidohydrolase n=1 Tax=Croceibacterium mercuriale TaxID=1572751 RepID=A0A0B2C1H5_9SPHN|nr:N-formylglutamate amidohydrolase [Croceibacterium mercuriale]KHL25806.1 N-formylglutamate amidohydrolase [Croceibacterium mercuriale]